MSPRTPTVAVYRPCSYCGVDVLVEGRGKNTARYCRPYCRTAAWRIRAGRKGGINKRTGERM